jgi:hypothetical protein
MPQIPDRRDLGRVQLSGADRPVEINPMVAYDIGRAGQAWNSAMGEIERSFGALASKKQKVEDDSWLSDRKIETLKQEDELRRTTEQTAGEDGTGYETVPQQYKGIVEGQEASPGGSDEARTKYKTWAAERAFETGRWGVNTSQSRLKDFNLKKLDRRLDEMTNLTATNPSMGSEYFKAYEEEVNSQIGNTIDAVAGKARIERARQNILKVGVVEKAKKNPTDYAKALKALDDAGLTAGKDQSRFPQQSNMSAAAISTRLETGQTDPLKGVANISRDSANSRSYGNFGLNSKGANSSAEQFANEYGGNFGLTAKPGTEEFNQQWKAAAAADPEGLHAAETKFYNENIVGNVSEKLTKAGVPVDMANDPRVQAYFADRLVQYGPASIGKHKERIGTAVKNSNGDAASFLRNMSDHDRGAMRQDFPTAIATGVYGEKGHNNRIMGRETMSIYGVGGAQAPSEAVRSNTNLKDLPLVAGSIQPAELMSLRPEDFHAVTSQMKPYLAKEMEEKVRDASAALLASGNQTVLSDEDLKLAPVIAGPKVAAQWKEALDESRDLHNIISSAKQMTTAQRREHIAAIRPSEDAGVSSDEEKKHFERWVKVNDELTKQMKANPVEFFGTQNESGKAALNVIATSPQDGSGLKAREKAYDVLLQLQRGEGLDQKDITLLPKDSAERVVNGLMGAKTGPQAIAQLDSLRNQYGKHFNTVWGQLQRAGAPDAFLAMPTATTAGQNGVIETYMLEKTLAESAGKDADKHNLLRARAGVKPGDLSEAVNSEIADLSAALDPSSFTLREGYRTAMERLTLYHMIANGKNVKDAASKASQDLFRNSVGVVEGVVIPNAEYGDSGTQRWEIKNGLRSSGELIRKYSDQIIAQVPPSRMGDAYNKARYVERVIADRRLVTSNDGKGVNLLDMSGGRVMLTTPEGPQPLFLSWEQLRQVSRNSTLGRRTFPN